MKRIAVAILILLTIIAPLRAGTWLSSGIIIATAQVPIAANQVLLDGQHRDDIAQFAEAVDIYAAANVTGFVSLQLVDSGNVVISEQPIQVGLGASPQMHFLITEQPGQHLRIANKVALTTGGLAVSMIYQ